MTKECIAILAIDDQPADAVILRRCIEDIPEWEVELHCCTTLVRALEELRRRPVDVVILDSQVKGGRGLAALRAIHDEGHAVPVVLLAGRGEDHLAGEARQAGAVDYLPRNALSANSLRRVLTNAVEKGRLQRLVAEHRAHWESTRADLARRNREVEDLYRTLSHDLKAPLSSASEFMELVLIGLAGPLNEQQREFLEIAREGCAHVTRCIDDLLEVTLQSATAKIPVA